MVAFENALRDLETAQSRLPAIVLACVTVEAVTAQCENPLFKSVGDLPSVQVAALGSHSNRTTVEASLEARVGSQFFRGLSN